MLIFDVDGVITEPTTGEVELGVIDKIVEALKQSEPVAFNTGRGLGWIAHNILSSIEARISKKSILNFGRIFIVIILSKSVVSLSNATSIKYSLVMGITAIMIFSYLLAV